MQDTYNDILTLASRRKWSPLLVPGICLDYTSITDA